MPLLLRASLLVTLTIGVSAVLPDLKVRPTYASPAVALAPVAPVVPVVPVEPVVPVDVGPTVMMFHGAPLAKPVYVTGSDTTAFGNLHARSTVPARDLDGRPYISVAIFWGPASDPALNGIRVLTDLKPEMAWQHGRFYPATAMHPAVLLTTVFTKRAQGPPPNEVASYNGGGPVPPAALEVLTRAGIIKNASR